MEKLIEYLDDLKDDERYPKRRCWMFGAIDFARDAELISSAEYDELLNRYDLV